VGHAQQFLERVDVAFSAAKFLDDPDARPYDEKALTLRGGEWPGGFRTPLGRNRSIDERRAGLQTTGLGVEGAEFTMASSNIGTGWPQAGSWRLHERCCGLPKSGIGRSKIK